MKKVCFFAIKPLRDTEPHVKVYKPPICKNADGTQERQHSNTAARGNTGGSPSGSAATARSRVL